jgi:elongation factor P
MISAHELKNGLALEIEGEPYVVLAWQHVDQARATAMVRLKLRHLLSGAIIELTLDAGHNKFRLAPVERHTVIFIYWDGQLYHFVPLDTGTDPDAQDDITLSPEALGEARKYIIDGLQLDLLLLNGEPVGVELPESIVMRVRDTDAGVNPASERKHARMEGPARLDTGLLVLVPPFISPGDLIRVSTSSGEYMERVVDE